MNERQAIAIANKNGLEVSCERVTKLETKTLAGLPAKRYQMEVGKLVCFYRTDKGGNRCWKIEGKENLFSGSRTQIILKAVELQKGA